MITLEAQITEVKRELALRSRVYPRWVSCGKLKRERADSLLEAMQAVLETLEALRNSQEAPPP